MNRKLLFPVIILLFAIQVQAQVGVGARGVLGVDGNAYGGFEFSIQGLHKYEVDLGFANDSWKATGLKLFPFIDRKRFGLYGGAGFGLGYYEPIDETFGNFALNLGSFILVGPIQVGLDWRPEWNFFNSPGNDLTFNLALSTRWVFGR